MGHGGPVTPSDFAPVRQTPDMYAVLAGLVDSSITTMDGRHVNRILRVAGDTVWVGTGRSPEGRPVDIRQVQAAADRLYRYGEIEISVASVGYRSAFVGAALLTLPGTLGDVRPRRIRVADGQ